MYEATKNLIEKMEAIRTNGDELTEAQANLLEAAYAMLDECNSEEEVEEAA